MGAGQRQGTMRGGSCLQGLVITLPIPRMPAEQPRMSLCCPSSSSPPRCHGSPAPLREVRTLRLQRGTAFPPLPGQRARAHIRPGPTSGAFMIGYLISVRSPSLGSLSFPFLQISGLHTAILKTRGFGGSPPGEGQADPHPCSSQPGPGGHRGQQQKVRVRWPGLCDLSHPFNFSVPRFPICEKGVIMAVPAFRVVVGARGRVAPRTGLRQ